MSLSSLIVQREIATIREVEEALARQVLYGGDLVTNLFEVTRLEEAKVTPLLAESYGLQSAPVGELPAPAPGSKSLVPVELATARALIPLAQEQGKLVIVVSEPLGREAEDELAFALGVSLEQRVAPSFRVRQAIAREYGVPLERRVQRLLSRISGEDARMSSSLPPLLRDLPRAIEPPKPRTPSPPAARLTPAAGVPLPAEPDAPGRKKKTISGMPSPPVPEHVVEAPKEPFPAAKIDVVPAVHTTPQSPAAHTEPPPVVSTAPPKVDTKPRLKEVSVSTKPPATLQRDHTPSHPPARAQQRRRRGPLTPETARDELDEAADRDTILNLFFDFARQYFDYTALFVVQGDVAEGRDAFGDGAGRDKVVAIGVPLDLPSVLSRVRDRAEALVTLPSTEGLDRVLLSDLGRAPRGAVLVAPVVVRNRVVALAYGDSGESGVDQGAAREVITFAREVGAAFEKIIVRKKLKGYRSGGKDTEPPSRVSAEKVPSKSPPTVVSPRAGSMPPAASTTRVETRPGGLDSPRTPAVVPVTAAADSEPPPPANLFQVRKPAGRPIPREEDHEEEQKPSIIVSDPLPTTVDVRAQALRKRADDASKQNGEAAQAHGATDFAEPDRDTVVLEIEPPPQPKPSEDMPPRSEAAVSIPAHRPPSSRNERTDEPSVIVDVGAELAELVARVLKSGDEAAEAELLRQGAAAMPALMSRFPGPITADPARLSALTKGNATKEAPPRVGECGPLLRLIAGQRRVALPFVLKKLDEKDDDLRFWATFLLTELVYAESAEPLVGRIFDSDPRVRKVARLAARALAETAPSAIVEQLGHIALAPIQPSVKRVQTVDVLGDMREPASVPVLVPLLSDADELVAQSAHLALVAITRQDFANDQRKWLSWWAAHSSQHRIEWLIEALMHEETRLRHAAGEELKSITKEYFGYYDDLPKRERERAQQRYKDWWSTEGHLRFRRA
jgi:MshEN domain